MNHNIMEGTMVEMTWCQVDEFAKKNAVVLLPVGVIEEHGRHLPLGTDIYLAVIQAKGVAEELNKNGVPCIIAPPFYWGGIGALSKVFPGSFPCKKETIKAVLTDLLEGLEQAGFRQVITMNDHGDPDHRIAITEAFCEYNKHHKLCAKWMTFEDDMKYEGFTGEEDYILALRPYPLERFIQSNAPEKDQFDIHAGAFETAFMRDTYLELTDMEIAKKLQPTMFQGEEIKKWQSGEEKYKSIMPDGHVGDPAFSIRMKTNPDDFNKVVAGQIAEHYQAKMNV
ncbi:MAG: creatininase family protein [bacterium]|nr:creatininase family protein [bacterium]